MLKREKSRPRRVPGNFVEPTSFLTSFLVLPFSNTPIPWEEKQTHGDEVAHSTLQTHIDEIAHPTLQTHSD